MIHRVARASQAVESMGIVLAATGAAVRRALPGLTATPDEAVALGDVDPGVDEALRFRIMTALVYTYRDLRDEELGRYAIFLESPVGRWFTRVSRNALLDSLMSSPERRPGALIPSAQR